MPATPSSRLHWLIAGAAALGILAALALLFRFPAGPADSSPASPAVARSRLPLVQMARATSADAVLKEETEIRDLRPLFLPTEFNVSLPEPRREPGRTFLDNEMLRLGFAEMDLNLAGGLPPLVTLNGSPAERATPVDVLESDRAVPGLVGFGRQPTPSHARPAGGGMLDVVAAASGNRVWAEALPLEARPAGDKPWEPIELLAMIDSAGLSTPLVVTASSRNEEVDAHYRNYLARRYRIGDRLPPGSYRIVVGP